MSKANVFYAQSGGVTAVINATACAVIETARQFPEQIGTVYAGHNGILGAIREELIDTSHESKETIAALRYTPGGVFGSCRYRLKDPSQNPGEFHQILKVFKAHNIRYFLYNGGGDSQDTTLKIAKFSRQMGYPLQCIGIPKTVDNDLAHTDNCPGFGSVAKYVAISIQEAGLDVASMAETSTKIFVLEVMGRHSGWIAAGAGLAHQSPALAPHIILFPEIPFDKSAFLNKVSQTVQRFGFCAIVVSEGVRNPDGSFVADMGLTDAFGHKQLGGVAFTIANLIKQELGLKYHAAIADYLQRAARHVAAKVDVEQAYQLGATAIEKLTQGVSEVMLTLIRTNQNPYRWEIGTTPLESVANHEKPLPRHFISDDGFEITEAAREYLLPLIQGEDYPPYQNGLPAYLGIKKVFAEKKVLTPEGVEA